MFNLQKGDFHKKKCKVNLSKFCLQMTKDWLYCSLGVFICRFTRINQLVSFVFEMCSSQFCEPGLIIVALATDVGQGLNDQFQIWERPQTTKNSIKNLFIWDNARTNKFGNLGSSDMNLCWIRNGVFVSLAQSKVSSWRLYIAHS